MLGFKKLEVDFFLDILMFPGSLANIYTQICVSRKDVHSISFLVYDQCFLFIHGQSRADL